MDASIDAAEPESNGEDLAVAVGTLEIDGTRPTVGDTVSLKVEGTIRKLVDETAFVTPSTINDQPIPPKAQATTDESLMAQAQSADQMNGMM